MANRSIQATILNTVLFFTVFLCTSKWLPNKFAASEQSFSFFRDSEPGFIVQVCNYVKRNFHISDPSDALKFLVRILVASFVKDGVIAVFMPNFLRASVQAKLVSKVEKRSFNQSWIPDNALEREKGADTSDQRTLVYLIGHNLVNHLATLFRFIHKSAVKILHFAQAVHTYAIDVSAAISIYCARTGCTTLLSMALLVLHVIQTFLRIIRFIYKLMEYILSWVCRIVNDIALLGVEIVQFSKIDQGEELVFEKEDIRASIFIRNQLNHVMNGNEEKEIDFQELQRAYSPSEASLMSGEN